MPKSGRHSGIDRHLPALGWLPITKAEERAGLRPAHRRLTLIGDGILDDYGFLNPELEWTNGVLGRDVRVPLIDAYHLLRNAADYWVNSLYTCESSMRDPQSINDNCGILPPRALLALLPALEWSVDSSDNVITNVSLMQGDLPTSNTRNNWTKWLLKQPSIRAHTRFDVLRHDPYSLIRFGYKSLSAGLAREGSHGPGLSVGVAVIALGLLGVMPRVRCQVCFRLAIPQRLRCALHSQSTAVRAGGVEVRSEASSRARLARAVMTTLGWGSHSPEYFWKGKYRAAESTLGSLLWDIPPPHCHQLRAHILLALESSPRVRALLSEHFRELSLRRQLAALRGALDPLEWIHEYWPAKICHANLWFEAAHQLAPGREKMSVTNLARLVAIDTLLQQGQPKRDIAATLGISPSHLSQLLKRRDKH